MPTKRLGPSRSSRSRPCDADTRSVPEHMRACLEGELASLPALRAMHYVMNDVGESIKKETIEIIRICNVGGADAQNGD